MCGRYALGPEPWSVFQEPFRLAQPAPNLRPSWNIRPTNSAPVILKRDGHYEMRQMRWGFQFRVNGKSVAGFNAKSETAATTWPYRAAITRRHCLVPATGFYEWVGPKRARKPHFIHLRTAPLMFMAGLWEEYGLEDDKADCFTILTTAANRFMQPLHTRMPVILTQSSWVDWLEHAAPVQSLAQISAEAMAEHEVGPLQGDHAGLTAPAPQGDFGF